MALTNTATVSYNGYTFNVQSRTQINSTPVYDRANRTVTQTEYTLEITSKVTEGAAQNATLEAIRAALERPGGELVVSGLGFGSFAINTATGQKDLAWGPKPEMLSWRTLGGDRAAEIVWRCKVAILNCDSAADQGQPAEYSYRLSIATDRGGYSTFTHSGYLRIPMTRPRVGAKAIPDTADRYLERFLPRPSAGYDRTISRELDESKCVLTFTVTDTERKGSPPPPNTIDVQASHTMRSEGPSVLTQWLGDLTATYQMAATSPRGSEAWEHFLRLLKDRVRAERDRGAAFFPLSMTIGEPEIYGASSASFSISYRLVFSAVGKTDRIFPIAGPWRPPPGDTWEKWTASLANNAQAPRGLGRYSHNPREDAIVDLCLSENGDTRVPARAVLSSVGRIRQTQWDDLKRELAIPDNPEPSATWLQYRCRVIVEETNRLAVHVPLPEDRDPKTRVLKTPALSKFPQRGPGLLVQRQETPSPVVQQRTSPGYFVRLVGRAVRYAYGIPRPILREVAGSPVEEANDPEQGTFWSQSLASWTSHPIYAAEWNLRYFVARRQGDAADEGPMMPHPFQQGEP